MVYVAGKKDDLKHAGYAIMDGIYDPLLFSLAMREAADMPMEYSDMKMENLFKFEMFTLPGDEALKDEKNQTLWDPVFNNALDKPDRFDRGSRIGWYSSTK